MAVSCPKCGKAVRPGSKFCGKCGAEMPGTLPLAKIPPESAPPPAQAPAQTDDCPHCGKPVRPGAKFCPSCGKNITPAEAAGAPAQPPAQPAADVPATSVPAAAAPEGIPDPAPAPQPPIPPVKTTPQPPSTPPPTPAAKPAAAGRPGRKRWWLLALAGAILLVCIVLAVVVFFLRDRLPIPFLQGTSATPTLEMTMTETITPTLEDTPTETIAPTETVTPIPSVTATLAVTGTASPDAPLVIFEDDFSAGWEKNWIAWGPPPVVGGENISLTLVSAILNDAGIHTREMIGLTKETTIEFLVQLNGNSPQDVIFFDWYTGSETPKPDDPPGIIHVQIGTGVIQMEIADSENTYKSCAPKSFKGVDAHIYQIDIDHDSEIKLRMDGKEVCELYVKPYTGSAEPVGILSFTGRGTLDDIRVTADR